MELKAQSRTVATENLVFTLCCKKTNKDPRFEVSTAMKREVVTPCG